LGVEILSSFIDFDAYQVFIELIVFAAKNLSTRKLKEAPSHRRLGEVFTLQNSLQFAVLFIKCQGIGFERVV
jgi:hypothetical protein